MSDDVDDEWAVLLATDDEGTAVGLHQRLVAGGIEAYVRDIEEADREDGSEAIQVIVPLEAVEAAIAELALHKGIADAVKDVGELDRVRDLGHEIDDLTIAELAATDGPSYALDELGSDEEIKAFLGVLEAEDVRFALDRAANVVVHTNDEEKVDQLIERLFDFEDAGFEDSDVEPAEPNRVAPTAGMADIDGRLVGDDLTPNHGVITKPGPSRLVYAGVIVVVIVLLLILVL